MTQLDTFDPELAELLGLTAHDLGEYALGLAPAAEELDHLLDLGTDDSPYQHRGLRVLEDEAGVY